MQQLLLQATGALVRSVTLLLQASALVQEASSFAAAPVVVVLSVFSALRQPALEPPEGR